MRSFPLSEYALNADRFTIHRERIAKALKLLVDDGSLTNDGYTEKQIEAALWCWLDQRIENLVDDLHEEIEQQQHNGGVDFQEYLERAALTRDTLEGTQPKELATVSTSRWVGYGDARRWVNGRIEYRVGELVEHAGRARAIHAINATEYGHEYLTLLNDEGAEIYVSPELARKKVIVRSPETE